MSSRGVSALFWIAAAYDGLLGAIFFAVPSSMFTWFGVTPPNHYGYVRFPALLLIVFAIMFAAVARNPTKNRNLIPYGIMLKASYSGMVFGYWLSAGIPGMWKPFAFVDVIFGLLFYWAYRALPATTRVQSSS